MEYWSELLKYTIDFVFEIQRKKIQNRAQLSLVKVKSFEKRKIQGNLLEEKYKSLYSYGYFMVKLSKTYIMGVFKK